eukprot:518408_1
MEKQEAETFTIFVPTLMGKTIYLHDTPYDSSVLSLKERIQDKEGLPILQQMLIYAGKPLCNVRKLTDEPQIRKESTVHLVMKLRGDNSKLDEMCQLKSISLVSIPWWYIHEILSNYYVTWNSELSQIIWNFSGFIDLEVLHKKQTYCTKMAIPLLSNNKRCQYCNCYVYKEALMDNKKVESNTWKFSNVGSSNCRFYGLWIKFAFNVLVQSHTFKTDLINEETISNYINITTCWNERGIDCSQLNFKLCRFEVVDDKVPIITIKINTDQLKTNKAKQAFIKRSGSLQLEIKIKHQIGLVVENDIILKHFICKIYQQLIR